jgi:hypothetical protein
LTNAHVLGIFERLSAHKSVSGAYRAQYLHAEPDEKLGSLFFHHCFVQLIKAMSKNDEEEL